jgi:RNA-directed DNA polymerase
LSLDPVRALQHALYRAAKADPRRRFHALYDKVSRSDVLRRAWVMVRLNNGAPGIDKITLAAVEEYGVTRLLDELACELREGRYRPLPARRVFIPKPGTTEQRPLSIPAVRDRIVQAAAKIVLEPVFEADFLPCSFGFRPRRSAHDALQVLIDECWRGRRWVVETDIASCFSAIPHDMLMEAVEERVCGQSVLKLLRVMLRAGVMEDGQVRWTAAGTPQGGGDQPRHVQRLPAPAGPGMGRARRSPGQVRRRPGRDVLVSQPGRAGAGAPDQPAGLPRPGAEGRQDPHRAPGGRRRGI